MIVGSDGPGVRCAMWAQEHGRAFFFHQFHQGIDSIPSRLVVRTAAGESFEIAMDGGGVGRREAESFGMSWRACDHFSGPSWRSDAARAAGRPAIECVPFSEYRSLLPPGGNWSCSEPGQPPGIPEAAREAIAVARGKAREPERWAQRGVLTLGSGPLQVQVLPWGCLAKEKAAGDEVWFLQELSWRRTGRWVEVPAGKSREDAVHTVTVPAETLVYWHRSDPAPKPLLPRCDPWPRAAVGGYLQREMRPSGPKQIDVGPSPPGTAPPSVTPAAGQRGTVGGM